MTDILTEQVNKLKSQNAVLSTKLTQAMEQLEKKTREITVLKRTAYLKKPSSKKQTPMELSIEPGHTHLADSMAVRPPPPASTQFVPPQTPGGPSFLDSVKPFKDRCGGIFYVKPGSVSFPFYSLHGGIRSSLTSYLPPTELPT